MKTVNFLVQGQFGNNLFHYFAAEIIKKIYGYDAVKPTFQINLEFNTTIDDEKFKRIIILTNNKALLLWDILLDIVKEKGHCSTSLIRQLKDSVFEAIDAFRTCGCYFHLLTFFKEVLDTTLCLIAHFDAGSVWQLERLQALVEIDKVSEVFLAEGLDHAIRVVFRNWDAVQFHLLGSKNVLVSVIHSLSSYLKIPIASNIKSAKIIVFLILNYSSSTRLRSSHNRYLIELINLT